MSSAARGRHLRRRGWSSPPTLGDTWGDLNWDRLLSLRVLSAASRGCWSQHMLPVPSEGAWGLGCVAWGHLGQLGLGAFSVARVLDSALGRGSRVGSEAT